MDLPVGTSDILHNIKNIKSPESRPKRLEVVGAYGLLFLILVDIIIIIVSIIICSCFLVVSPCTTTTGAAPLPKTKDCLLPKLPYYQQTRPES
jgi:hypothetical protein